MSLACINIVVAANAGGAFSPFGDITTLMVWQKGVVGFGEFFRLFVPSVVNFVVPAALMHFAVPRGAPPPHDDPVRLKLGARRIALLFVATIATAVAVHNFLDLPPVLGMMTGLGYLQLSIISCSSRPPARLGRGDYTSTCFRASRGRVGHAAVLFRRLAVRRRARPARLSVPGVARALRRVGATAANVLIGVLSAILDNIPLMFAVLTMQPDMSLGQWLLITLTTGVGGSLLSIGSAAGVALMGQARGIYTFAAHLRWTPAVAVGYAPASPPTWRSTPKSFK